MLKLKETCIREIKTRKAPLIRSVIRQISKQTFTLRVFIVTRSQTNFTHQD